MRHSHTICAPVSFISLPPLIVLILCQLPASWQWDSPIQKNPAPKGTGYRFPWYHPCFRWINPEDTLRGAITPLSLLTGDNPGQVYSLSTELRAFGWRLGRDLPRLVWRPLTLYRTRWAIQGRVLVSVIAFGQYIKYFARLAYVPRTVKWGHVMLSTRADGLRCNSSKKRW